MNRHLAKEETWLENKHMKRDSKLFVIIEIQFKPMMRFFWTWNGWNKKLNILQHQTLTTMCNSLNCHEFIVAMNNGMSTLRNSLEVS